MDLTDLSERDDNVWRNSLQTLLVGVVCGEALGLLPGRVRLTQGSTR